MKGFIRAAIELAGYGFVIGFTYYWGIDAANSISTKIKDRKFKKEIEEMNKEMEDVNNAEE